MNLSEVRGAIQIQHRAARSDAAAGLTNGSERTVQIILNLPLLAAGLHLAFAFPMIQKLLMLFNLMDIKLLILTTLISFLIFALFYMLVYRKTSKAYFAIVSDCES